MQSLCSRTSSVHYLRIAFSFILWSTICVSLLSSFLTHYLCINIFPFFWCTICVSLFPDFWCTICVSLFSQIVLHYLCVTIFFLCRILIALLEYGGLLLACYWLNSCRVAKRLYGLSLVILIPQPRTHQFYTVRSSGRQLLIDLSACKLEYPYPSICLLAVS